MSCGCKAKGQVSSVKQVVKKIGAPKKEGVTTEKKRNPVAKRIIYKRHI
jgi:hypothetical protein